MIESGEKIGNEDALFCEFRDNRNYGSFEKLYSLVRPWLYKMIFRLVLDKDVADDVYQETWIKIIEKSSKFDPAKGKINNYIFTIAKNEALRWKNRKKRIAERNSELILDFLKSESNPEVEFETRERNNYILQSIEKLPQKYQDVLILYYYVDLDINQIAETLERPTGTVKTWLSRGKKQLGKFLSKNRRIERTK